MKNELKVTEEIATDNEDGTFTYEGITYEGEIEVAPDGEASIGIKTKVSSNKSKEDARLDDYKEIQMDYKNSWLTHKGVFFPALQGDVVTSIPPGTYTLGYSDGTGIFLQKDTANLDELIDLPIPVLKDIVEDITSFWEKRERYEKYKFNYKRGILLHGPAGCGKSYAINILTDLIVNKHKGTVINLKNRDHLSWFVSFIPTHFRRIEKNTPLIVIIEDVEGFTEGSTATESLLLNVLDGVSQVDNVVFLATTNYPEKLKDRFTNRPSRFDRLHYFGLPSDEVRKYYFEKKIKKTDRKNIDIKKWVKGSEGLTVSHLRELLVSTVIMGNDFDDTVKILKGMSDLPRSEDYKTPQNYDKKKVGFGS